MTDFRSLCARMADELDHYRQLLMDNRRETHALANEARAALAQPEPQGLTVEDCDNMSKHKENYIYECSDGNIQLDGYFTREDLIELARTIPTSTQPSAS